MAVSISGKSRTKPHVIAAINYFAPKHGITQVGGWRAVGSVPGSAHPKGLAADYMTRDKVKGDALAADAIANAGAYGITEVIWWRRINTLDGRGWRPYNGPSAHTDHVHLTHSASGGSGTPGPSQGIVPVDNPLVPDQLEAVGRFASWATDPETWKKAAMYVAGVLLIIIGALLLAGFNTPGVKDVVKVARKVAVK